MLTEELRRPVVGSSTRSRRGTSRRAAEVVVAGRSLPTSEVFDTYWVFASRRHEIYQARLEGGRGPWTDDPILQNHRFTNCYRAADRVSQFLISQVIYRGTQDFTEVAFRTLLFKLFNKIDTWQLLIQELGETPSWSDFDLDAYDQILSRHFQAGHRLYSAAYVMAPPRLGAERKHTNHLRLLRNMMATRLPDALQAAPSMAAAFDLLREQPGIGDFLAFQYLIDLNYSEGLTFDEMDFVVAGPGAKDGIRKCFGPAATGIESEVIAYMAESQNEHFDRLGLTFDGLRGRELQLIDCQNLFCEVDKYARVAHPSIAGRSGRSRIKQRFAPVRSELTSWFPPKWGLNSSAIPAPP